MLRSTDGGSKWVRQYRGPRLKGTKRGFVQVQFIDPLHGWAVSDGFLLRSTNGGRRWTRAGEPPEPLRSVAFVSTTLGWGVSERPSLANGPGGRLVRTFDGGETWIRVRPPGMVQSVCFSSETLGWAAAGERVYRTTDGGETWVTAFTAPLRPSSDGFATLGCSGDSAWVMIVAGGALGHQGYIVFHTKDGGAHWDAQLAEQYMFDGDPVAKGTREIDSYSDDRGKRA